MQSRKIEENEVLGLKVSSLPTRPTATEAFGGKGYTANEMKAAFDKLPEFLLERLNLLIEDLLVEGEGSYVGGYKTGIKENHTLKNLIDEIMGGEFSDYLKIGGESLTQKIALIEEDLAQIKERLEDLA